MPALEPIYSTLMAHRVSAAWKDSVQCTCGRNIQPMPGFNIGESLADRQSRAVAIHLSVHIRAALQKDAGV